VLTNTLSLCKEDGINATCSTHWGDEKNTQKNFSQSASREKITSEGFLCPWRCHIKIGLRDTGCENVVQDREWWPDFVKTKTKLQGQ